MELLHTEQEQVPAKPERDVAMRAAEIIAADRRAQYPLRETPLEPGYSYESD